MNEGKELVSACWNQKWDQARKMIAKNSQLVWTARGLHGATPAYPSAVYGNVEMLQHMLAVILQHPLFQEDAEEKRRQMLQGAFERGADDGYTPAHTAAHYGHVNCLAFLVEHAPSGAAVLEAKSSAGRTPAHCAAVNGQVDALEFIVRNAPSGIGVLEVKSNGGLVPLDLAQKSVKAYFTPQKIKEIGFERELGLFDKNVDSSPLASLIFGLIRQNVELEIERCTQLHTNL